MRFMPFVWVAVSTAVFAAAPSQPLRFEANQGQADSHVRFLARGPGYTLFLAREGAMLDLRQAKDRATALRMTLPGSDPAAEIAAEDRSPVQTSYFIGRDQSKWHADVPSYERVRYRSVYPGIDLVFYGNDGQLEYDFVVAPRADPARIALTFDGAEKLEVDAQGTLLVHVPGGDPLRFHKPVVYQDDGSGRREVAGAFVVAGVTARFALGTYDHAEPLVIDPVLKYSTYFNGGYDYPTGATGDASGNGYVVGWADLLYSGLFATPGAHTIPPNGGSVYVAKFSPAGALTYLTFLGGSNGSDGQGGGLIQVDSAGNVWIAGTAESPDFPVTSGAWQPTCQIGAGLSFCDTGFLAKLSSTGTSLLYATYTSATYGDGQMYAISLDKSGNVYATGFTYNQFFPTTPNAYQPACPLYNSGHCLSSFFFELNPKLSGSAGLIYSSFFSSTEFQQGIGGIAVDSSGMIYLAGTGGTASLGFVAKINPNIAGAGAILYENYFSNNGQGNDAYPDYLTFDAAGNLYVTGHAPNGVGIVTGYYTPCPSGAFGAFVAKLDPATGNVLNGATLGCAPYTQATGVAADSAGNVYVLGATGSSSFPIQSPVQSGFPTAPYQDFTVFVASLDPTLSTLRWSTFLGDPVWGSRALGTYFPSNSLGVDRNGNVFVAGSTPAGSNLPTIASYQSSSGPENGYCCGFVARIGTADAPALALGPGAVTFPSTNTGASSAPETVYIFDAGSQPMTVKSIAVSGDFAIVSNACKPLPATLAGGANCQVTIAFNPTSAGTLTGSLTVVSSASPAKAVATLTGIGVAVANLTVSPTSLTFPATPVGTSSAARKVTITSTGSLPLTFSSFPITGTNSTAFTQSNTCPVSPASLGQGQSCTVSVVMQPPADGPLSATLTINTNYSGGGVPVALSGSGPDYTMSANPASITVVQGTSGQSTITLKREAGLTGKVALSCTVPSGSGITCSFAPPKVALSAAPGTSTATLSAPAGIAPGAYPITILGTLAGGPSVMTTVQLTAVAPSLVSIAVTPANPTIAAGAMQQFTATGTYNDGSTQNLTATAVWSSSSPAVAGVNASGLASGLAPGTATIQATAGGINGSTVLNVAASFAFTGSLNTARDGQTATLLNNGMVLIAGGCGSGGCPIAGAELYNPATGVFTPTGSLNTARYEHTATLLSNGMVLIAGGSGSGIGSSLSSAELYNPATGTFTPTASLKAARQAATATPLNNGMVLIAGGTSGVQFNPVASAELYNPATASFAFTGSLNAARSLHTATLLNSGLVLIAGGVGGSGVLAVTELFNPATGVFTSSGNLKAARYNHTATLLQSGLVLVAGGQTLSGLLTSAELYDPVAGTFAFTGSLNTARVYGTASALNSGMVLLAGGQAANASAISSAELYDPSAGFFHPAGSLNTARYEHTATLLNNGTVLVAGGLNAGVQLSSAELYGPAAPAGSGPVLIGGQPQNQIAIVGNSATFVATAIGTAPITYQWNRNGVPIGAATAPSYTTPATSNSDNGASFTVTVANGFSSFTSLPATLTVTSAAIAPVITAPPLYTSVSQGNTASFYVTATGTAPLTYQWSKNGSPISGATGSSYTTPPTTTADNNAQFTVTVSNSANSAASGAAVLTVTQVYGLGGFQPVLPGNPSDVTGVQYRFKVVTNQSQALKILFDNHTLTTPGSPIVYNIETNVYSDTLTFANGGCTIWPLLGTDTEGEASLRNATPDYPFNFGQQPSVGSSILTSDPANWPIQTYNIDNIPNLWKSDSISQFGINGVEALVTIQQGGTLTDVSAFQRCGLAMVPGTYRMWTVTTQMNGLNPVVNQVVVPDADGRYMQAFAAMQFYSEFLYTAGTFAVQYWDFAYMRQSNPVWTPLSTFMTNWNYDGSGQDFGIHVVNVNGRDVIEFSDLPGNVYMGSNLPFSIAVP